MIDESSLFVISPRIELYNFIFVVTFSPEPHLVIHKMFNSLNCILHCLSKKETDHRPPESLPRLMGFLLRTRTHTLSARERPNPDRNPLTFIADGVDELNY